VEVEASARCHTEAIAVMDMASKHPIIHLPVRPHPMGPSSAQAGVASHGVEGVAEYSAAGEGFVVGSCNKKLLHGGLRWKPSRPYTFIPCSRTH
jgi:hypothetical protein